jgi:hypothetical protein
MDVASAFMVMHLVSCITIGATFTISGVTEAQRCSTYVIGMIGIVAAYVSKQSLS